MAHDLVLLRRGLDGLGPGEAHEAPEGGEAHDERQRGPARAGRRAHLEAAREVGGVQRLEAVRVEAEQIMKIKNTLVTMYAQMTGQTRERVIQDLGRDNYMSAQAALEYGLIDKIIDVPGSGL